MADDEACPPLVGTSANGAISALVEIPRPPAGGLGMTALCPRHTAGGQALSVARPWSCPVLRVLGDLGGNRSFRVFWGL